LKYYTMPRFAIKAEALFMQKMNTGRFDQNLGIFVGFSYTIGSLHHQAATAQRLKEQDERDQRQRGAAFESLLKQQ